MKVPNLTSLEIGSHYVLINSENSVMAVIGVVDDVKTTLEKIEQAIRDEKCIDSEDSVVVTSAIPKSCDLLIKVEIVQFGDSPYKEEFSLIKSTIY